MGQRLINADNLKEEVKTYLCDTSDLDYGDLEQVEAYNIGIENCLDEIEDAPAILTIPENPTNGDMIKAMFPEYEETHMCGNVRYGSKEYVNLEFVVDEDWWNAPYGR